MRRVSNVRQRGESLLEVIIAVAILSMIMVSVFALLIRGASTNVNVTNRVVAINVAREGMEAVRNIRDTNWLKYSGDLRGKWLCLDTIDDKSACEDDVDPLITEGTYIVEFSEIDGRYFLEKIGNSVTDKRTLPTEEFRLYLDNSGTGRFKHESGLEKTTKYYRQVYLSPEDALVVTGCTDDCPMNVRLQVLARVQWQEEGITRHLDMETYLYDFFGRDEY